MGFFRWNLMEFNDLLSMEAQIQTNFVEQCNLKFKVPNQIQTIRIRTFFLD